MSTTFTRRAGLAAMLAPILAVVGGVLNATIDRGPVHGLGVGTIVAAFAVFAFALLGLRRRHGGLGGWGRAVASPFLSAPFAWMAGVAFVLVQAAVTVMLGIAMLRARVLPAVAVALFALAPVPASLLLGTVTVVGFESLVGIVVGALLFALGLEWVGFIMWREPALDAAGRPGRGPLAAT